MLDKIKESRFIPFFQEKTETETKISNKKIVSDNTNIQIENLGTETVLAGLATSR
jgi:hypothetical protein